ncbi:carbohydrate binding domain-containing protein [Pseudomonas juntendi]|uniref:carbohydrate binding domain-containing protein n=2 Tax=Pseudomonas TaxID=286 RepID=UPI003F503A6B
MYDPVGAFKDVFGGVQGVFAGLTGAAKISGGPSSEPSSQTVRSSKAPVRFILGRASTGGVLAWVQEQSGDQTSGEWIHIVYVLSEGAIAGVDEIYVDERPLSDLGENATSEVIIDPTQVNAFLLANCPDWRQEQIGRGLSFVRLSFKYDAEKFPSGIPDVRFVVRGRSDIYDPRNGNSGYSANTALLILWYLRNRCAIPDDEIIFQSFASAANICDETVIGPDGKMSPRYFAGAVIGADEKRNTVLDNLLSACAGTLIRVGGRWSLQVGAYYGPADFTINEDMVIGTVEGTTEVSNSDAINTMRGTFVDPAQAWAETDYPEVAIQDWIATDGGELAESQSFAYVTDAYLAQRLANISLRRRRSGGSLSVPLNFNGYNCRPGRAVKVDLPSLNILGEFMVTEWTMGAADACKVTLKPYEQAIFDDAVGQPYDPLGFINLPVGGLAAVTGLAWTPSGVAEVIQGVLSWTPPVQTVLSYTVTIRKGTEVVQSLKVGGEASSCNINGLSSGTYAMSVVAFGPGTRSGEATLNVNVGGPPVPESCAVYASVDTITLVPANLQNSLNGGTYEYFYATNPSAPIADAVYLGQGLTFTHTGLAFAKEYSYYVRSANAYGKSDFLYVLAATSSDPTQMLEVIAGQITESELGRELTKRIDLIDMDGPGSVNERVGQVRNELNEQITEVNNSVDSVSSSLSQARNELQQQISAVDQNVESAKTSLAQQIAVVNQAVGTAKTDLQQQINTVSVLAGSLPYNKDKTYSATQSVLGDNGMLYQALKAVPKNTPPPNATYWTDVGQAIVTAAGTATRVSKVETDVSTLDGKTTAQASQIGGLQTGLTATNQNVATAQQAADAANTLAGGKGKVIVQAAAPAAADRLAQNLWIDTTGNANTPKRWSGSAWVAVTDKAATDAAAAAASALALAQTKADATAVNNLTLRVSDAEGKLVAEGQRLDGLQTSLDGKASSTALQQVTSRVTATESKNTAQDQQISSQSSAIVSLTDSVAKKAEASTVQALSNTVNQHGQDLTAQGQSLLNINAALPLLGGENLVFNPSFEKVGLTAGLGDGWWYDKSAGVVHTFAQPSSTLDPAGVAQRVDLTGLSSALWFRLRTAVERNIRVAQGISYTLSLYIRAAAGLEVKPQVNGVSSTGAAAGTWQPALVAASGDWLRYSVTFVPPVGTTAVYVAAVVYGSSSLAAGFIEVDRVQLEQGTSASGWRDNGQVIAADTLANANATSSLSASVTQNAQGLVSQAEQLSGLTATLTTTGQNVAAAQQAADAANTLAGGKGKVIIQASAPAAADRLAQNLWIDTAGNANTPKRWSGSAWVAVTDKAATDAAAAAASALALAQTKADATAVNNLTLRVSDAEGKLVSEGKRIDGLQTSVDGKASSAALQEVTSRVTATERDIASTSSRTSTLENTVNSTTNGLPSKASTAALNSVSGRVTATEQGLSSQAESVNGLTASIKAANAAGGNIVPNASFDPAYSQMGYVVLATTGADVPAGCPFKYAARLSSRDHYPALADVPFVPVKPGDIWRVSALVACVSGTAPFHLYIQVGTDPATIKGTGLGGGRVNTTSVWTRTSWDYTVPADVFFIRPFLQIGQVANGGTVWLATDWHMEDVSAAKTAQATADATATALSSTQATVTQQGEKLVAEGKRIDGLRVDVDSKASSAIVQALTQRVTATEGKNGTQDQQISSQSAALLALTDTVAGKANASTVQALSNTVNQQGQDLTAAGAQLTNISASLSDAGSENLIYNPSFEKPGTAAGVADGWGYTAAGGTRNPSQPASTLAPGGVTQRIDLTGLSSSVWFRLRTATDKNVKVASGSTYTLSLYVRATAGLDVKAQINGLTSAGAASGTWQTNLSGATGEWRRLSVTFTPADTTVEVYLAVVVYGTASTSAGFIEVDNAQFERGTIPTGWRDNNSVTDAAQSATAAAVDLLTATVSQQAGALSSVSGRTTNLENSLTTTNGNVDKAQQAAQAASDLAGSKGKVLVQTAAPAAADRQVQNLWIDTTGNANTPKRWNGTSWAAVTDKVATDAAAAAQSALAEVAKKADATAVQALSSRVTANEQGLTSAAESVTNLGASIKAANSAGGNVIPNATFDPAFTRMGFTVLATTASGVPAGCPFKYAAQLTGRDHNPALADVPFVAVKPGDVWRLNALVACAAGTASFNLYIQIGSDPGTVSRTGTSGGRLAPTSTWTRTTFDYTVPAGVYFIRPFLQIDQAAGAGTVWYATDWHMEDVSAAKAAQVTADATAAALSSTQATVAQQGNKLTAETSRIDGLYASVGDANAAIQNEANARANADSALTQQIQTTQSSLGDTNASVQQISKAQTDLKGKVDTSYTVKLQAFAGGIYAAAGIALGIEKNGAVLQSTFAVMADKFAVLNATANGFVSPFSIQYGQVFLTDAFIRDGSIINAKIQDAAIDNAKIANGAITAAKIGVAEIDTLRIRGNAVTVPVSASSAGIVYGVGEGQWRDLIAIGVQMDEAGYITAQYSCYQGFGSGIRKYQFRMEINGLVIAEGGGDWADGFPNLMGSIGVGAGYFVITVKWWGENAGVSVKNHTLYAMGTKR